MPLSSVEAAKEIIALRQITWEGTEEEVAAAKTQLRGILSATEYLDERFAHDGNKQLEYAVIHAIAPFIRIIMDERVTP